MKKFVLWCWALKPAQAEIFRKAGFLVIPQEQTVSSEMPEPDVVWIDEQADGSGLVATLDLNSLYPKIFIVSGAVSPLIPIHWQTYDCQSFFQDGETWRIGSKLEDLLPLELTEDFANNKTADWAAILYMTLLKSLFRETAEWCGHMSSVVGRM